MEWDVSRRVNRNDVIRLVQDLIRIPSSSGSESEIAEFIAAYGKKIGLEAVLQPVAKKRFNVICKLRGSGGGKRVLFQGHIDTMPPDGMKHPYAGVVKDGKVWGRGASDMKGSLASMLIAAKSINESDAKLRGDMIICGTADEEAEKRGIYKLVGAGIRADAAVSGEPTSMQIHLGHRGGVWYTVSVKGKGAHGSTPEKGVNSIYKMMRVADAVQNLKPRSFTLAGVGLIRSSINVGVIQGGSVSNFMAVPEQCKIWVDRRTVPGETVQTVLKEIDEIIAGLRGDDGALEAQVNVERPDWKWRTIQERGLQPSFISKQEAVVKSLASCFKTILGRRPTYSFNPAWTEADFLINVAKIPTVIFGPGEMNLGHTSFEHIRVENAIASAKIYALLANEFAA